MYDYREHNYMENGKKRITFTVIRDRVKPIRFFLLLFLTIIILSSAYLINQQSMPKLSLDIKCEEYLWDGETEDGEWISGNGTNITLYGIIKYNSFTVSELNGLVAKITVYDKNGLQFHEETPIQLHSSGISTFKRELNFENSFDCPDQRYSVSFYSPEGVVVPHRGDFENSINNPSYSGPTPTPNYTQEAILNTVFTAVWQTAESATNVVPASTTTP
jgi:hypothetical protein